MLIWTTRFTKKKAVAAILLLGLLLGLCIFLVARSSHLRQQEELLTAGDNEARLRYLQSLGWEVEGQALETLDLVLPDPLTEDYLSYNALQQQQGFDLSNYCGQQVCRYTYALRNYPGIQEGVQANLYLCQDRIIAGDVCYSGEGGFIQGLSYPEET